MEIRERIAEELMKAHGYNREDPIQSAEWREESPSAYSMMLEDADIALQAIMTAPEFIQEDPEPEALLGVVTPPARTNTVSKSVALFIFMDAPEGTPTHVKDVREWLKAIEDAGIPDDTEIEGHLHISYDYIYEDITKNTNTITIYDHRPR